MRKIHIQKSFQGRESVDAYLNKIGISTFVASVPKHFLLESLDIKERFLLSLEGVIQEKYILTSRSSLNFSGLVVDQGQKGK